MGSLQTIQAGKVVLLPASAEAFAKRSVTFYVTSILSSSTALFRLVNSNALSAADLNGVREIRLAGSALSPGMIHRLNRYVLRRVSSMFMALPKSVRLAWFR